MRVKIFRNCKLTAVLVGLSFLSQGLQIPPTNASAQDATAPAAPPIVSTDTNVSVAATETPTLATDSVPKIAMAADAAAPMPPVRLSPGAAQIVQLAQSGVGNEVMLAFIANSASHFNLGSDQIIYLNDLGVSETVVKAMMTQDQVLTRAAAAQAAQTQPPVPADTTVPPPTMVGTAAPPMPGDGTTPPPQPTDMTDQSVPPNPSDYASDNSGANPGEFYAGPNGSDYFFSTLAPYGNWIYVAGCGRCWQPSVCLVNHDWRPYCDRGRWLNSDCGWYWQSDYSWGWAAFHYGRWFFNGGQGWVWQPGRTWGPAWVSWRYSHDYCGWAPLPPGARFAPGVGLAYRNQAVGASFEFGLQAGHYTFVPTAHFADASPARYRVPPSQITAVYRQTVVNNNMTVQNHKVINHGIDPAQVAAVSQTPIRQAQIRDLPALGGIVRPDRVVRTGGAEVVYRAPTTRTANSTTFAASDVQSQSYSRNSVTVIGQNRANLKPAVSQAQVRPNMNFASQVPRTQLAYSSASEQPNANQPYRPATYTPYGNSAGTATARPAYVTPLPQPSPVCVYRFGEQRAATTQPQWIAPNRISSGGYSPSVQWNAPARAPQMVYPTTQRSEPTYNNPPVTAPSAYRSEPAPAYRAPAVQSHSSTYSSGQSSSWQSGTSHH